MPPVSTQRFREFLENLAAQGISQKEVAFRAKVPVAYLSDVKAGSRTLTELFARRLREEFDVDYLWLLGRSESMLPKSVTGGGGARHMSLPVFDRLVDGDPNKHRFWDGSTIEIVGAAAAKAASARLPYIFRCGSDDRRGRLQRSDLVLVTQDVDESADIQLVKHAGQIMLARHKSAKQWESVLAKQDLTTSPSVIGHAIGIIWGSL